MEVEKLAKRLNSMLTLCGLFLVRALIYGVFFQPHDDTDNADVRSGLRLYTDHRTGCQYLSAGFGSLTPRLTSQGMPLCGRQEPSS